MPALQGRYAEYEPDPGLWHRVRFWGPVRIRWAARRARHDVSEWLRSHRLV